MRLFQGTVLQDYRMVILLCAMLGVLLTGSVAGWTLRGRAKTEESTATADNLVARTTSWWIMVGLFGLAGFLGLGVTSILFALLSFFALREMITISPTRRGDHHTLFWIFFVMVPVQYYLVYTRWYGLFAIFIPVYGFLWICIRSTLTGDYKSYMERVARIYLAAMVCIYAISHAPALLTLDIPNYAFNVKLLFYLAIVVQFSDVMQYVWGKLLGRHKIAPHISPSKTWEGLIGGGLSAVAIGTGMRWMTPFDLWWQAAAVSVALVVMGFFGGIVMSAIKRDAGVKDYSQLIPGHGGVMDRIDSLCFAAPVFFHITRYYFAAGK